MPDCAVASPSLLVLVASGNYLEGTIPAIPPACALTTLDLSANGAPLGPNAKALGLTVGWGRATRVVVARGVGWDRAARVLVVPVVG